LSGYLSMRIVIVIYYGSSSIVTESGGFNRSRSLLVAAASGRLVLAAHVSDDARAPKRRRPATIRGIRPGKLVTAMLAMGNRLHAAVLSEC
jgi:hypothetical protein